MSYKCKISKTLYKNIFNKDDECCDMSYEFELGFPPYTGLYLEFESFSIKIDRVIYDIQDTIFTCVPLETDNIFWNDRPLFDYETAKNDLITNGWKISYP